MEILPVQLCKKNVSVYIQGGGTADIITGGATEYMMDDIEINIDILEKGSQKTSVDKESQIIYTFRLSNIAELDEWLESNDHDFLAKCVRKFKLHLIYSNAVKGFFFDVVKLFESYVLSIIEKAGLNKNAKIAEYRKFNEDENLDSSSIILYKFGKDGDINKYLEKEYPYLFAYIKDRDRWSYAGWCPLVPDIRFKHLLEFPLELVCDVLGLKLDIGGMTGDLLKLKKLEVPNISDSYDLIDQKYVEVDEKVKALHERIKSIKDDLVAWEEYYSESAAQVLEQTKIFRKYFPGFGKANTANAVSVASVAKIATLGGNANLYKIDEGFLYELCTVHTYVFRKMLGKFYYRAQNDNIVDEVKNSDKTNDGIYDILTKHKIHLFKSSDDNRDEYIIEQVKEFIEKAELDKTSVIIDYGCNDGKFINAVAKYLDIDPKNVHCYDINDTPDLIREKGYNYTKIDTENIYDSLKYMQKADMIFMSNVLHHVPKDSREAVINAFIGSKSKYLLVKEHNCSDDDRFDANMIRLWHNMYMILFDEVYDMGEISFISYDMFSEIAKKNGFSEIASSKNDKSLIKPYYVLFALGK